MAVIIFRKGMGPKRVDRAYLTDELELQNYVFQNPEILPFEELKDQVQFTVLLREYPVSVGSIDILGVDNEGDLYIIETKLYKNPDKRRVLAQVLDYGAALWDIFSSNPDDFVDQVDDRLSTHYKIGLRQKLEEQFGEAEPIIEAMKQNISSGAFRFIVLMDRLEQSLKNLILFVNEKSQFTIYAVELEWYVDDNLRVVIPHVFGGEIKKRQPASGDRRRWDEESFFREARASITEGYEAVAKLYEFSRAEADTISWGRGAMKGSFSPKFHQVSRKSVYTVKTDGSLYFHFGWLGDSPQTVEWTTTLLERLKKIPGLRSALPDSTQSKWHKLPIQVWADKVDEIINVLRELLKRKEE